MADGSSARAGGWGGWGVGGRDRRRPALERENGVLPHIDLNPGGVGGIFRKRNSPVRLRC